LICDASVLAISVVGWAEIVGVVDNDGWEVGACVVGEVDNVGGVDGSFDGAAVLIIGAAEIVGVVDNDGWEVGACVVGEVDNGGGVDGSFDGAADLIIGALFCVGGVDGACDGFCSGTAVMAIGSDCELPTSNPTITATVTERMIQGPNFLQILTLRRRDIEC